MFKKTLCTMLAAVTACAFITSCGDKTENKLDAVKKKGNLVAFTNPTFPPYQYAGEGGKIVGIEMDIVERVAQKLGVKADIQSAEFDSIIASVKTGKADIGASGITITDERKTQVDFSVPFVSSVQYIIIPENSPIATLEDLAGKKIGGQQGTTGYGMLEDAVNKGALKDKGATMLAFNDAPDAVTAMTKNKVDVVVIDELVAISLAQNNPGYKAIKLVTKDGKSLKEEFGIAVAKGNEDLLKVINEVIEEMKKDGSLQKSMDLHKKASNATQEK